MISVPTRIMELYHQDTCKKNIRIHFPNGERQDICNDLIVKDSVKFTESLCSQDQMTFGLCEASQFECETVGVGNVNNAKIEVFCEIYCESSVSGAEWRSDLEAYVYSIPYGTFYINSSQRQADMIHRKIVALNYVFSRKWGLSRSEEWKNTVKFTSEKTYAPSIAYFISANGLPISDDEFTVTQLADVAHGVVRHPSSGMGIITLQDGTKYWCVEKTTRYMWHFENSSSIGPIHEYSDLLKFNVATYNAKALKDCEGWLKNATFSNALSASVKNEPYYSLDYTYNGFGLVFFQNSKEDYPLYINPQFNSSFWSASNGTLMVYIPTKVEFELYDYQTQEYIETKSWTLASDPTCEKMVYNDSLMKSLRITFPIEKVAASDYRINFGDVDVQELANAFFELSGKMAYADRSGKIRLTSLKRQFGLLPSSSLYPGASLYPNGTTGGFLLPNDYQTCWYNDGYSKPYGAIKCKYKDSNEVENIFTYFLSGYDEETDTDLYAVYDLSNNSIISSHTWTANQIQSLCANIALNIDGVSYIPVEFRGRGLPYVEAGDTFEILTKSNDSITTIVLNRTISGEQTLTDTYKSV